MNILDKIVKHKKEEIAQAKKRTSTSQLEEKLDMDSLSFSMTDFIKSPDKSGIIAEFKRRSPSKPVINLDADVVKVTTGYVSANASALSILTDSHFFGGSSDDLLAARSVNSCPILRKDFIIDPYQILESKVLGADAILLIAEILTPKEVESLSGYARTLGLEILMELHSEDQLGKYHENVHLVGVNNRDLKLFKTDIGFSISLAHKLPSGAVKVSESGISDPNTIKQLKDIGYEGFLIGERFMASTDPGTACQQFIKEIPR